MGYFHENRIQICSVTLYGLPYFLRVSIKLHCLSNAASNNPVITQAKFNTHKTSKFVLEVN